MCQSHHQISLGFTEKMFPAGVHICQIFCDDNERHESLMKYILKGIKEGEKTSCFSGKVSSEFLSEYFDKYGISFDDVVNSGTFALAGTSDVYFENGRFDINRSLNRLKQHYLDSVEQGYPAARVIGEMTPEIQHVPGGGDLLEYESRVSMLLKEHPVTTVCQYDARGFDGALIMDILKVHPMVVVRGEVVHNPFFIPPEEFLSYKSNTATSGYGNN